MHWTEPATSEDSYFGLEQKLGDVSNMLGANTALKLLEA